MYSKFGLRLPQARYVLIHAALMWVQWAASCGFIRGMDER